LRLVTVFFVVIVDTRDRRDARILIGGNLRAPFLLIPIVNSTDERRNQGYSGFGARHSLGEAEEKRQIAVNAFFLKKLGCPNALQVLTTLIRMRLRATRFFS